MFGETNAQKWVNGVSFSILVLMLLGIVLAVSGVGQGTQYTYEVPREKIDAKFGYHVSPRLKSYQLPEGEMLAALMTQGIDPVKFGKTINTKLQLNYSESNELMSLTAVLTHGSHGNKDLSKLYEVFRNSVDKFVSRS